MARGIAHQRLLRCMDELSCETVAHESSMPEPRDTELQEIEERAFMRDETCTMLSHTQSC